MKKIPLFILAALAVAGCATKSDDPDTLKVLMIGNSFSLPLVASLPKVAQGLGVDLDITSLYIQGCSLERHARNLRKMHIERFTPYQKNRNVKGEAQDRERTNFAQTLMGFEKYDVITIQQCSAESWKADSYDPWGGKLLEAIRTHQPQARIYLQETWSYTPFDRRLAGWGITADEMYERLHAANLAFAEKHGIEVIPTGTAVQEWRRRLPVVYKEHSLGGDVVGGLGQKEQDLFKRRADLSWEANCDVSHLNERGEYLQALVWAAVLFDEDVYECDWRPDEVERGDAQLMCSIANGFRKSQESR